MEQTTIYKEALENELLTITSQLNEIAAYNDQTGDWVVKTSSADSEASDENLLADDAEEADERIAVLSELEIRYRNIKLALKKIETGTYGICEISGEQIEEARLKVNPAARTCIAHIESESQLVIS